MHAGLADEVVVEDMEIEVEEVVITPQTIIDHNILVPQGITTLQAIMAIHLNHNQ
jgi:hypothetical protein